MICSTPVHLVCNYAASSQYCKSPDPEQVEKGVIPLDSLPADWWNWMWADTNKAVNEARAGFTALINELESVLDGAGIVADCNCVNQVYRAIDKIRQTLATAATAGAVKSSPVNGNVTVNEDGTMTANGLGNVTNITFGNVNSVVSGLNCLYTYTSDCFTAINGSISSLGNSKAPVMHADTTVIYGVGNASCYGHVKLSDTYNTALEDQSGVAASQKAINDMYNQFVNGMAPLSNTTPKPNNIDAGAAGTSTCAARADHQHPAPQRFTLGQVFTCVNSFKQCCQNHCCTYCNFSCGWCREHYWCCTVFQGFVVRNTSGHTLKVIQPTDVKEDTVVASVCCKPTSPAHPYCVFATSSGVQAVTRCILSGRCESFPQSTTVYCRNVPFPTLLGETTGNIGTDIGALRKGICIPAGQDIYLGSLFISCCNRCIVCCCSPSCKCKSTYIRQEITLVGNIYSSTAWSNVCNYLCFEYAD